MKLLWAAAVAAGLMLAAMPLRAQTPAETRVTVGELIGLDPVAVRTRMAGLPVGWPMAQPALSTASDHGVLDLMSSASLIQDPADARQQEHYDSGDFGHAVPPHLECRTFVGAPDDADNRFGTILTLLFTGGRLSAIYPGPSAPPRSSPFIAAPGQLPLQDGDGFIGRWPTQALTADVSLTTRCAPWQAINVPAAKGSGNSFPDLSLLPLVIFEPPTNAARTVARRNGQAVLSRFKLGAPLSQSLDDFADSTPGVRVFRNPAAGYALIVIDMGALPSNHLDNVDDVAMVGIHGDTVTWIMPSGWRARWPLALSADLLCLDDHFVPGRVRTGCSVYGHYTP